MRKLIAASLLIAFLSLALSVFFQIKSCNLADKRVEVAGTFRSIDDNGWLVISDKLHKPINIGRIKVRKGYVLIQFTFAASKIHSFMVTPDETFVRAGYSFGASVYRDHVAIAVSRVIDGKVVPVDASSIRSRFGNFWIYGLFSVGEQDS